MARADLLVKLVKASLSNDRPLLQKTIEAIIAEEKKKQHNVLADELVSALNTSSPHINKSIPNGFSDKPDIYYLQSESNKRLEDLVLTKRVIAEVNGIVEEQHRADLLRSYSLEPRNRILLVGPPGNGKTSLAEAVSRALMLPLFVVRYDAIISSYLGETASRLKKLFDFARTQNCVLFFDEFDTLGKERGDTHETGEIKRVVSSLLLQIDSLPSYSVVIAATNHPELLDRAVWRRFQVQIRLEKPTREQILMWFDKFQKKVSHDLKFPTERLVKSLYGASFSDIEEFATSILRKHILALPESDFAKSIDLSLEEFLLTRKGKKNAK